MQWGRSRAVWQPSLAPGSHPWLAVDGRIRPGWYVRAGCRRHARRGPGPRPAIVPPPGAASSRLRIFISNPDGSQEALLLPRSGRDKAPAAGTADEMHTWRVFHAGWGLAPSPPPPIRVKLQPARNCTCPGSRERAPWWGYGGNAPMRKRLVETEPTAGRRRYCRHRRGARCRWCARRGPASRTRPRRPPAARRAPAGCPRGSPPR